MNLFIVSNLGQLFQAQNVIKQYKLKKNVMVVLWTKRNTVVRDNIVNNVDKQLFDIVETLQLPNFPNKLVVNNLLKIRNSYRVLIEKYPTTDIFVCNFNSHYNFLYDIAKEKGIQINLFEEGLSTYKFKLLLDRSAQQDKPNLLQRIKKSVRVSIKDTKNTIKETDFYLWIRFFIAFIYKNIFRPVYIIVKGIVRIILSVLPEKYMDKIINLKLPKQIRSFKGTIPKFDDVYLTFPERGREIFEANAYHELNLDYELTNEVRNIFKQSVTLQSINKESVIFLDQVYNVPPEIHTEVIVNYLHERFPNKNVFIKMHPRSKKELRKLFEKKIGKYKHIQLLNLDVEVPFEAILLEKGPRTVVSVASTSLVYAPKLVKETKVISCANYYLSKINHSDVKDVVLEDIIIDRDTIVTMCQVKVE
ncbi:alpha-2,8-polysialyltransferase family protein [Niallia sp. Krafla_26]|uniref:alpha-2,8-polysialyltransferase family protein n=1 Tax=Niallia sp. Krafla_26 TaxID=3064703 RepID=UPI003D16F551